MDTIDLLLLAVSIVAGVLYFRLGRNAQNWMLLLGSYAIYYSFVWYFPLVLLLLTAVNFTVGLKLAQKRPSRKMLLLVGIGANVLVWLIFKSSGFLVAETTAVIHKLNANINTEGLSILLPVGLSFYTLQGISYLLDVSRKQAPACNQWVLFALYMAYFPKLTSGPIERARQFIPKLAKRREVSAEQIAGGIGLLVLGLARKVIIADVLFDAIGDTLFATPDQFPAPKLIVGLLFYVAALYNDFAGYTDIARGMSRMLGIELSINFRQPVFAYSVTDLWNRWHITLSSWLRDYIYFPLSRWLIRSNPSQKNIANLILPPLLTMSVSGLWHGMGWNFVIWGLVIGSAMVIERWIAISVPKKRTAKPPWWRALGSRLALLVVVLAVFPPFIMGLSGALRFFTALTDWSQVDALAAPALIVLLPSFGLDWMQHKTKRTSFFHHWPIWAQGCFLGLCLIGIAIFTGAKLPETFVYQGF